ncbi:oxidoreductase [Ilyonectria sp. MPI-CAGE-AT-0026]|nr:oxidoreductase [Ilyonectria sp. MPI-CAGE-AT-0026]
MAPINVGIVGYGFAAKSFHLPFITANPEYNVAAILQRAAAPADPSTAPAGSHCTVDYPKAKHYRSADEFFADPGIELVVVATHGDTHALFAEKALTAGKHVIADKPFTQTSAEANGIIELAKKKNLILTCFQNRRWDGDFQTLRKLIGSNAFGSITEAEIHYDFETPTWLSAVTADEYAPGLGMTYGLGTHSLDQAVVLFGRPKSVTGFFRAQREVAAKGDNADIEDAFTIILQYDGDQQGLLVTVKTSIITPMNQQLKYLVRGSEGSYVKFQQRSTCVQEEQIAKGLLPTDPRFGIEPKEFNGILTTLSEFDAKYQSLDPETNKYSGRYPTTAGRWLGVYENLAAAIKGTAELEVKAEQSRDGIRIIELARESHKKGCTVAWS